MEAFYSDGRSVLDPFTGLIGIVGIQQTRNTTRYVLGIETEKTRDEKRPSAADKKKRGEIFDRIRGGAGEGRTRAMSRLMLKK